MPSGRVCGAGSADRRQDDPAASAAGGQEGEGSSRLLEGEGAVDNRVEVSGVDELLEGPEVVELGAGLEDCLGIWGLKGARARSARTLGRLPSTRARSAAR
ncbi:hypothetical protein JNB_14073 [Janibacter sp. HTCC2649]|nr:hypothetical protein JNB_14073 [Janibacter sp. HTCC2649]